MKDLFDETKRTLAQKKDPSISLEAGPNSPRCPFGHKSALIYLKIEDNVNNGRTEVYRQCDLAAAVDDDYSHRVEVLHEAGCPAADSAQLKVYRHKIIFKRTRFESKCKFFTGKWILDK